MYWELLEFLWHMTCHDAFLYDITMTCHDMLLHDIYDIWYVMTHFSIGGRNREARGPWPLLNLRTLHRIVIFAIENHFSLAKWPPLLSVASSASAFLHDIWHENFYIVASPLHSGKISKIMLAKVLGNKFLMMSYSLHCTVLDIKNLWILIFESAKSSKLCLLKISSHMVLPSFVHLYSHFLI